jgi:hypothetical protein
MRNGTGYLHRKVHSLTALVYEMAYGLENFAIELTKT